MKWIYERKSILPWGEHMLISSSYSLGITFFFFFFGCTRCSQNRSVQGACYLTPLSPGHLPLFSPKAVIYLKIINFTWSELETSPLWEMSEGKLFLSGGWLKGCYEIFLLLQEKCDKVKTWKWTGRSDSRHLFSLYFNLERPQDSNFCFSLTLQQGIQKWYWLGGK